MCGNIFSVSKTGRRCAGRLLTELGATSEPCALIMDKAYEGDETGKLAAELGFSPVVPPKSNRTEPWEYDKVLYKKRNEVEGCSGDWPHLHQV